MTPQALPCGIRNFSFLAVAQDRSVVDARAWGEAVLGSQVCSHHLLRALHAPDDTDEPSSGPTRPRGRGGRR